MRNVHDASPNIAGPDWFTVLEELSPATDASTVATASELLLEYGRFVSAQPSISSFCFGALEQEAASLPESFLSQGGSAIIARRQNASTSRRHEVGFIAWRALPDPALAAAWEIKRLWVRPEARGLAVGRALVERVIEKARAAGKTELLLDTAPDAMPAANRLYREMSFVDCPPYLGPSIEGIEYLRKQL